MRNGAKINAYVAFDTLNYCKNLVDAGMDEKVAEVQAEMNAQIIANIMQDQVITKKDVAEIKKEIHSLRFEAKHDLHELEKRLYAFIAKAIAWSIGILGAIQGALHFVR